LEKMFRKMHLNSQMSKKIIAKKNLTAESNHRITLTTDQRMDSLRDPPKTLKKMLRMSLFQTRS
jgi:hypothetical protein